MRLLLRPVACVLPSQPLAWLLAYWLYPELSDRLRFWISLFAGLVVLVPHALYIIKNRKDKLSGVAVFMLGQLIHIMALLVVGVLLMVFFPQQLRPGLMHFLICLGSFLVFQLASLSLSRFCVSQD